MSRQIVTPDKQYIHRTAVTGLTSTISTGLSTSVAAASLSTAFIVLDRKTGNLGFNIENPISKFHFFGDTVISGNLRVVGNQVVTRMSVLSSASQAIFNTDVSPNSTAFLIQTQSAGFPMAIMNYKNVSSGVTTEVLRVQNEALIVKNLSVANDVVIGHDLRFEGNIYQGGQKFYGARDAPEIKAAINAFTLEPEDSPVAEEGWTVHNIGSDIRREFRSIYFRSSDLPVAGSEPYLQRTFILYDPNIVGTNYVPVPPNSRFVGTSGKYIIQVTYLLDQGFQKVTLSLDGVALEPMIDLYTPGGLGTTRQVVTYTTNIQAGFHTIIVQGLSNNENINPFDINHDQHKNSQSTGYGFGISDITLLNLGFVGNVVKLTDAEANNLVVKSAITIRSDLSSTSSLPVRLEIFDINNDTYLQIQGGSTTSNVAIIQALNAAGNNTVPLAIQPNANVGFGTFNPAYRLDMRGDVAGDYIAHVLNSSYTGSGILIETANSLATTFPFQIRNSLAPSQIFMTVTGQGRVGYGINSPDAGVHYNFTDAVIMPKGTTLQRPASGFNGMIRYNTDQLVFEYFNEAIVGDEWLPFSITPSNTFVERVTAPTGIYYLGDALGTGVGFGTSAPGYQVDVNEGGTQGPTNPGVRVYNGTNSITMGTREGDGVIQTNAAVKFVTNSSDRMIISSTGNVGIGTMTPNAPLHVNGNIIATNISLSGTLYSSSPLTFSSQTITGTMSVGGLTQLSNLSVTGNITAGLNIYSFGNVGINTNAPVANLDVNGRAAFISRDNIGLSTGGIRIGNGTKNDLYVNGDSAGFLFEDSTTKFLRISSTSGNVYVGNSAIITNPSYRLQVDGDINFTGNVYQNGTQYGPTFEAPFIDKYPWETADSDPNENIVPVGCYLTYSDLASLPSNYLRCDGAAISRTTHAELFGVIGTIYGIGDGSTTFNLPVLANTIIKSSTPGDSSKHIVYVGSILFMDSLFHSGIPNYYVPCNGAAVNRIAYSELFAIVGTTYGVGDTLTTFNLPNIANGIIKIASAPSGQLEIFPIAACLSFSTSLPNVPINYIRTDGSEISRGVFADLYRVIKQTYGSGDGLTTFDLPTLANRIIRFTNSVHITYMDGKVGIGEQDPQYNLDVVGDINFTGNLYHNGTLWRQDSEAPIPRVPFVACDQDASEDLIPVGSFVSFLGSATLPADYLLCDGSAISRTIYAELFAIIGTGYGSGDGSTTFNLPLMFNMIIKYRSATGANKSKIFVGSYLNYPWTAPLPSNYLQCDGSAISRTTYSALFAVIGTAYGSGDGINTFNVPFFYNYIIKFDYPISGIDTLNIGTMLNYGGSTALTNYIFADGSEVSRHTYDELFNVTSISYGAGNGYTTFNLPAYFATIIRYTANANSVCYSGNVAIGKSVAAYPLDINGVVQAKNTPKAFLSMILDYAGNPGTFKYSFLRSFNVASVTYSSASGNVNAVTVSFTTPMSTRNYVIQGNESPYYYNGSNAYVTTGNYISKLAFTNYATTGFSCTLFGSTGQNLTPGRLDFVIYDSETNVYNGTPTGTAI